MRTYVIKRLLMMIPTFLGISLIVFAVLNLAPGKPGGGQQNADLASDMRAEGTQESYRIFREQFNLDKPILFNTLPSLETNVVAGDLAILAGTVTATGADRVHAQDRLEGYGTYSIPHLVTILRETNERGEHRVRDVAAYILRLNARRKLIDPFNPRPPRELRDANAAIGAENAQIRTWRYGFDDPEARKQEVTENWIAWFDANQDRWQWSTAEKAKILVLDTRFAKYWGNLARFDFGVSLVNREPVLDLLVSKLRYSISLSMSSLLLAYLIALPLGVFSAVNRDSATDRGVTLVLFMLYSLPSFFVATLLLYFFSQGSDYSALRIFPTGGWRTRDYMDLTSLQQIADIAWHLVLPVIVLTYGSLAALSRYMRTGLLDVIRSDYVRTARAKGLPEWQVIGKHAVRNGLLPVLTLLAGLLPAVLGGSVIVEVIFDIPGMGLWMVESIYARDYNVIMAIQLITTVLVLFGILITDLSYALVDPRIRYE